MNKELVVPLYNNNEQLERPLKTRFIYNSIKKNKIFKNEFDHVSLFLLSRNSLVEIWFTNVSVSVASIYLELCSQNGTQR